MTFREFLAQKKAKGEPVFFDGGMGTMIQKTGVSDYAIPEDLNFSNPDVIKDIHAQYLRAGSAVITANSFGANPIKISGTRYTAQDYITKAIQLVKESISEAEANGIKGPHFCAWDSGQIGKLLEPMGPLTFDQAYNSYKEAALAAEKAGADLALIETMSDLYEVKAAVLAIHENTSLPVVTTMTYQTNLRTLTGADVLTCVTYLESLHVDMLGFNCGGSLSEDEELTRLFCQYAHLPLLVQPNAGLPVVVKGKTEFKITPQTFAQSQVKNRQCGVVALGGCCGTTPEHIAQMVQLTKDIPCPLSKAHNNTFLCSYNKALQVGDTAGPVIIGERINPTGKKKCKEALQAKDMQFFIDEAESQISQGAHILDVNVGLPGIDEAQMMVDAIKTIQSTFNIPLQIDSSESAVLEKALRYYNGKALVNSVNGKQEVMDAVFPLIARYGGSVVALCIDEKGIAPTAEGRCAVARKIITEAAKYGIEPRDIFIDTLTLTVSSEQKTALETVKAIRLLHEEFKEEGLRFVLGVSNISFGLPRRDIINSRFFMLALDAGLSACIINPASQQMMDTFRAYRTLSCYDENALEYIQTYTGTLDPTSAKAKEQYLKDSIANGTISISLNGIVPQEKKSNTQVKSEAPATKASGDEAELISIIEKGFKDQAGPVTKKLLSKMQSVEIIDRCIVPALDAVGKDFENGKKFLPQLLLSAETVGNAFSVIKESLAQSGNAESSKGTVVLATVFGDIHDIGKNIVKAMLENYGYEVIDLGKNVDPQLIIDTVLEKNIQLVGLSALMTTTVANMEETIKQLRAALAKENRTCKIVVGGAVLTPEYAEKIGADYYSKDAMQTVAVAKEVFGS